ncbi:ATP-dependent DNA ligase [Mycobacterium marseillense]|uniref:DNA ligase (ATP) n=1 Tax=Mycobacterium marseillense TaxID=701042 RepID=A0ABM7JII2_9MYCO|nr:ATP-dependent DNA ligase [Mycobacterium marseillense]MCV7406467.1 ATP-dependent DNA ligase [Mycobacterium marseillense]ORA93598.1 ATP-dependent DNA ligase [Mycobacterium marseillense]BBY13772.1 multifunctional non-homologous end joining protein LigD [Mycobacterium marseillense]
MSSTAGPRVKLTNAEKVLYPATGTTKSDIFDYYTQIAEVMIPHVAARPATRKRWPNGVEQESFFEKQLASSAPDWLPRASVTHRSGTTTYPIIDDPAGLAWIAQQAALEVHVPQWRFVAEWTRSRAEELKPGPATRLVFDLDPGERVTMAQMAKVARAVRDLMAGIGLTTFPLTSGSKGLHLYAPLDEPVSSKGATVLAKRVAQQLEKTMPKLVTSTMTKSLRAGKIFLDWSQNNGSKTTIAPYSLRGREHPTVAAPRTWDELDDPSLRQLRYDEVLARVARDGDLLAELDASDKQAPVPDRLTKYRSMRDASKTPEPVPVTKPAVGQGNSFVIQEHHARRLHYDFRLERDGVLVSWAVPKNLPETPSVNHLAVHTEDHPLEYGGFEGVIPKGEYGAGKVIIWDSGTYDAEKFLDDEVIVNLHGAKISGRYALIQTNGDQWLAHRMKDQKVFEFDTIAPMLATHGSVTALKAGQWAFEGKWDGYRLLIEIDHGSFRVRSRRGREVTQEYRELRWLADGLAEHHVVLDGEAVVLDSSGVPNFHEMQNRGKGSRVEFWAFDLLYLDGRSLLRARYRDRRKLLEMLAAGSKLIVPDLLPGDGKEALEHSGERGWEGVIAKKRDSTYQPGRRSSSWIKDKHWNTQEIVIGGWKAGEGGRSSGIGSLLMGIPSAGGLRFAGRVGTGFTERDLAKLKKTLAPLHTDESPFDPPLPRSEARGVTYVRPVLVGEVRYSEWTPDDRLRQSSWRGLRPDKEASEVVRE